MLRLAAVAVVCLAAAPAHADQPAIAYEPARTSWNDTIVQWSTWVRLGYGIASDRDDAAARSGSGAPASIGGRFEAGFGADLTLPLARGGTVRLGPWAEARTSGWPVVGAELQLAALPRELDMFFYDGEGLVTVRGGGNHEVVTAAIAWGYRCPWDLFGWRGKSRASRYMIGARVVASYTRAVVDPRDWSATVGLEVEPAGALRYLLGIRSWY